MSEQQADYGTTRGNALYALLDERDERIKKLEQERDHFEVLVSRLANPVYLGELEQRLAAAEAATLAEAERAEQLAGELAKMEQERDALKQNMQFMSDLLNDCQRRAKELIVERDHQQHLAETAKGEWCWLNDVMKLRNDDYALLQQERDAQRERANTLACQLDAATERVKLRAELVTLLGTEDVAEAVGTVKELRQRVQVLRRIADHPAGDDEPGEGSLRRPAWEMSQWARATLAGQPAKGADGE